MREQGSEAWQRGKREATGAAKRGREKDGKYRRDQERPREGRRKGKQDRKREHDRERERESKRDSEIGGGSEARRGEARRPLERADTCVLLRTLGIRACRERRV